MYQALYRKWRPQTFDEVVGQQHITETLKNQIKSGRLSHAYLFIGTRGTGKTTCARILARAVNCEHPVNGNPCGKCAACLGISDGSVLDVVELDAASNNSVDNVRALREEAVFSPASVRKRVYIIDEVHMLSGSAFNALLKILEEPPEHLMFILATTELQKVPATILSRCQRHSFRRIDAPVIADYLMYIAKQERFSLSKDAAELIARLADGGVRDALSLLDQCSAYESIDLETVYSAMGLAGMRRTVELMKLVLAHNTEKALTHFNALWMDGKDPASLLTELSNLLRDSLMIKIAPKGGQSLISAGFDTECLRELSENMTTEELLSYLDTIQKSTISMRVSSNPKTVAELCLVTLCDNSLSDSTSSLKARISRLESKLDSIGRIPLQSAKSDVQLQTSVESDYPFPTAERTHNEDDCEYERETDEDGLNAEAFFEEQPEDSFIAKRSVPVPDRVSPLSDKKDFDWAELCKAVSNKMPRHISLKLSDENTIRGYMQSGVLHIEAESGFIFGSINKPNVISAFSEAASAMLGHEVNTVVSEMSAENTTQMSIESLKKYPEVRFI